MKLNKILAFFAAALLLGATACNDDDLKTPLADIQGGEEVESYTSLTFNWKKVDGAVQYGYQLFLDDETPLETGVTNATKASFSNLIPDTEYTLKVWAYADPKGSQTTSEPIVLKARTKATTILETPQIENNIEGRYLNVYWETVEGATSYTYSLTLGEEEIESGTTSDTSLWFYGLEAGTYTATVKATNPKASYSDSKDAVSYITITRKQIWKTKGLYKSGLLNSSWEATIVAYSDNSYSIQGWYLGNGYNLDFYIDTYYPDNAFVLDDGYEYDDNSGYYKVPTGRSNLKNVWVYPWDNYCSMTGDKDNGVVSLDVYGNSTYGTDTFVWGDAAVASPADDFVGTWTMTLSGMTALTPPNWDWEDYNSTTSIEITKVDETTISLPALYFSDQTMTGKIDMENRTITIKPFTVTNSGYKFTFAANANETTSVVGKINSDGSISFDDFTAWNSGSFWLYEMTAKLTR